jgi:NAD(P)-dependent dehydrogenase (short-subunit alcohol dehydrogenase family)
VDADVSDEQEVEAMFKTVEDEFGTADFLVNNAGIKGARESDALDPAAFDRVISSNLRGSFLCAQQPFGVCWRTAGQARSSTSHRYTSSSPSRSLGLLGQQRGNAEPDPDAGP